MKSILITICFLLPFLLLAQEELQVVFPLHNDSQKSEFLLADQVDDILKGRTICGDYNCIMQVVYIFWNNQQFYYAFKLSETIDEEEMLVGPENLNLTFTTINEQEFLTYKNNYNDKILFDSTKIERPGFSFSLETDVGSKEFSCPEDYNGCVYYGGYLEPLQVYLIVIGYPEYATSFAVSRRDGGQFPFDSPFDEGANTVLLSKEEDQLLVLANQPFSRGAYIGLYQVKQQNNEVYFFELRKFQTDRWSIEELVWIDSNNFALKVYDDRGYSEEEDTTVSKGVKYLKARIGE